MKKTKILLLAILPLILTGCSTEEVFECDVDAHMLAMVNPDKKETGYTVTFKYKEACFDNSATQYSNNLKMMSFASSLASENKEEAQAFFTTIGYEEVATGGYDAITENSVGYYITHKTINEYDMLAVSIRGFEYEKEWANNFQLGAEGNHAGFDARASEIFDVLKPIMASYSDKTLKMWLSGYSRAGAIANVLASKILSSKEVSISKDDFFVYTFEAPAGLSQDNAIKYENVFNHINPIDLVANVPPATYGLKRCGIDKVIDYSDVDEKLVAFDSGAILPSFTPSVTEEELKPRYANEQELLDYLFDTLLKDTENPATTLNTREKFAENYQDAISYLIALFITLPESVTDEIVTDLQSLDMMGYLSLLGDDGLYNFLKPIFDSKGVTYDDTLLKTYLGKANQLIIAKFILLAIFVSTDPLGINQDTLNNILRIVYMHSPETVYVLIK